jgi:hypothetical protein
MWVVYWESLAVKSYDITLALPTGSYTTEWMDVTTGKVVSRGAVKDGKVSVPGNADMVLVVRRK